MAFTLTEDQQTNLKISPKSRSGATATVDGVPVWTVDNPILTLTPAADGLSCGIAPSDTGLGNAQVKVEADADLGAGVRPLIGILDVTIAAGEAVTLGIDADAATPRP